MRKEKEFELHKKVQKPSWYLTPIEWAGTFLFAGPFTANTKINKINCEDLKPPYLVFSTHASFVDFANMLKAMFPYNCCWVTSIEEFGGREWLFRHIGCIPKRKFTKDTVLIRNCVNTLKKLKTSVVIYPEARFSLAGINEDIGKALGKFAKLCGVPVVVMNQRGNFIRSPQWNKRPYRKGFRCEADFIQIVNKEEIKTLSPNEIQARIEKAFVYDDYKWQYDNKIKIKALDRAKNLHKILYKCPCCNHEQTIQSYQHFLECTSCKAKWYLDEYSRLHLITKDKTWDESLSHIPTWYLWERECVNKEVENGTYFFEDMVRVEKFINAKKGFVPLGEVKMTHSSEGIILDGKLYDGTVFNLQKPCASTASLHIEYNFKKIGDAIDIATIDETYFVFPLNNFNILTKLHFATEALYKKSLNNCEEK